MGPLPPKPWCGENRGCRELLRKGNYGSALAFWQQALDAYHQGFDRSGQVDALVGLSRCYIRTKEFSEALVMLQRAHKLEASESVDDALKKCHRMAAVEHLRRAQQLYTPDSFGKAYLETELAIREKRAS